MSIHRLAVTISVVAIAVGVGCSDDNGDGTEGGASTSLGCEPQPVPVLCSDWAVSGGVDINGASPGMIGSFNAFELKCSDWADGGDLRDDGMLEAAAVFEPIDEQDVDLYGGISGYSGPGSYDIGQLAGLDGDPFAITAGDVAYQVDDSSTDTYTVRKDGGGELVFDGFVDTGGPVPETPGIAGSVSWTCVDPVT